MNLFVLVLIIGFAVLTTIVLERNFDVDRTKFDMNLELITDANKPGSKSLISLFRENMKVNATEEDLLKLGSPVFVKLTVSFDGKKSVYEYNSENGSLFSKVWNILPSHHPK